MTLPPKTWPMHWCPRQTPKVGICGPKVRMISFDSPASRGEHGPGEIENPLGCQRADLLEGDLVVAMDLQVHLHLPQVLHQVVGERIVVVYDQHHSRARGGQGLAFWVLPGVGFFRFGRNSSSCGSLKKS